MTQPSRPPGPSADLRARVLASIKEESSPTLPAVRRRRLLTVTLGFVPLVVLFQLVGGIRAGDPRPTGYVALLVVTWTLLAAAASWGSLARGTSMLGRPRAWLVGVAVATPLLLLAAASSGYVWWPATALAGCGPLGHLTCVMFGSLMGIGPLVAFVVARSGTDPVHPRVTGAAIGAAAGAWGSLAIGVHCTYTSPVHEALGHVLPVLVLVGLGVWTGRWVSPRVHASKVRRGA